MKVRYITLLASVIAVGQAPLLASSANAQAAVLRVNVDGVRSDRGSIRAAVIDAVGRRIASAVSPAARGITVILIHDVSPGEYAVRLYHDENGNERMDRSILGLPREGYGFSRSAHVALGMPSFASSRVTVTTGQVTTTTARIAY